MTSKERFMNKYTLPFKAAVSLEIWVFWVWVRIQSVLSLYASLYEPSDGMPAGRARVAKQRCSSVGLALTHSSIGPGVESHQNPLLGTMERSFAQNSDFPCARSSFFAGIPRFPCGERLARAVWRAYVRFWGFRVSQSLQPRSLLP